MIRRPLLPSHLNYWGLWLGVLLFNGMVAATLWNAAVPAFMRLEQQRAQEEMATIGQSLAQQLEAHRASVVDFATWDDAYNFVQRFDPEFVHSDITPETLYPIGLAYLAFFDTSGRVVYGAQIEPTDLKPLPPEVERLFRQQTQSGSPRGSFGWARKSFWWPRLPLSKAMAMGPAVARMRRPAGSPHKASASSTAKPLPPILIWIWQPGQQKCTLAHSGPPPG